MMTPEELMKMTKAQLLELARRSDLRVTGQMTKADLIEVIAAAAKKGKAPLAPKPKANGDAGKTPPDRKRIEAARKAARKFIAGAGGKPPKAKKPNAEKAAPPQSAPAQASAPGKAKTGRPARGAKKKAARPKPAGERKPVSGEAIRQAAEEGKFYLGAEQRAMPPVEATEIPKGYNVDRIIAMVRDPYWVFTYWEITDHKYRELERAFGSEWPKCKMILRIYDRTNETPAHFDIVLSREARTWYINVSAGCRYQVAIGALSPDGRFETAAISGIVETPSGKVSDRIDEQWLVPDDVFDKIFAASGGFDMHSASGELKGLLEKHLLEQMGSGAVTSFGSGALYEKAKGRGFRFWIMTELILYGGTEPDARVTVQGKEVKLRPDGTFSMRFALPDGKIDLPVTAESGDGIEERLIETAVSRKSNKKAPVLR